MKLPENIGKANYNGVVFSVPISKRSTQRAIVQHHSPYSNRTYKDDLGLLSDTIRVNGFVWGNGAYAQAAKLREELNKGVPGTLQHPEYGELSVYMQNTDEEQDYADGLYFVSFSISFVRDDESEALGNAEGEYTLHESHATKLATGALALQQEFSEGTRIRRIPAKARLNLDELQQQLASIQNEIQNLLHLINAPSEYAQQIQDLYSEMLGINLSPLQIAATIMNTTANVAEAILSVPGEMIANLNKAIDSLKKSFERIKRLTDGTTPQQYEMQLQAAASQLATILIGTPKVSFQSKEQVQKATQDLQTLITKLKPHLEYAAFEQLVDTEQAFVAEMDAVAKELPKEKEITSNEPLNVALFRAKGRAIHRVANPFFPLDGPEKALYV